MVQYFSISSFRNRIDALLKIKRNVYAGVLDEIKKEFSGKSIEEIRRNRDMILIQDDLLVIKLRLPDKKQRLSKKDGYRLIYLVSRVKEVVVFLDVYPKNGPEQQLSINDNELLRLLKEFSTEATADTDDPDNAADSDSAAGLPPAADSDSAAGNTPQGSFFGALEPFDIP